MKVYVHEMGTHRAKNKEKIVAPLCTSCHIHPRYWQESSGAYSLYCSKCRNIIAAQRYHRLKKQKQKV